MKKINVSIELMFLFKDDRQDYNFKYFKNIKELKVFLGLNYDNFVLDYPNFCIKVSSDNFDGENQQRKYFTRSFFF